MKQWAVRIAVLLAVPVLLAFVDSRIRPVELSTSQRASQPDVAQQPSTPEENQARAEEELAFVQQHFENASAIFVDARPLDQYEAGHIPGAFHLAFGQFMSGRPAILDFLPQDMPMIVYCEGGDCDSSHKVREMLLDYGYQEVHVFQPGFPMWQEAGLPLEEGPPAI